MSGSGTTSRSFWTCSSAVKVSGLFVLCSMVYVYLYSAVSVHPSTVKDLVQDTIIDLHRWRNKMESWVMDIRQDIGIMNKSRHFVSSGNIINKSAPVLSSDIISVQPTNPTTTLYDAAKAAILNNETIPLVTLFTTWPTNKEKFACHNNTISNWLSLKPFVQPILFTNESDLKQRVLKKGWTVLPISKSGSGIPILKYMYLDAMKTFKTKFYAYCNGDILFTDSLVLTLLSILNSTTVPKDKPMMIIGRRTNVKDVTVEESSTWKNLHKIGKSRGKIFTTFAEDYFITLPIYPWKDIPEVVIGRRAYDNWLVLNARKQGHTTVDGSNTILAVHQTTKSGNFEGHSHKNGEYNHNLLRRLYKRLHYGAGLTSCAQFYTNYKTKRNPEVLKRKVHKSCFPM